MGVWNRSCVSRQDRALTHPRASRCRHVLRRVLSYAYMLMMYIYTFMYMHGC